MEAWWLLGSGIPDDRAQDGILGGDGFHPIPFPVGLQHPPGPPDKHNATLHSCLEIPGERGGTGRAGPL